MEISRIQEALQAEPRVVFAYLYGSFGHSETPRDLDIAVYAKAPEDVPGLGVDIQIALGRDCNLTPDLFDVRIINALPHTGDLFALLYLKNVLETGVIMVDKAPDIRTDYLEQFGMKYRSCEGLFQEVLL